MPDLLDTYIENRERVQPTDANNYGTAHGGNVTKWMDEVGAMSAMRFAGETCVTASIDQMDFERPIPVGETALIDAYVFAAGRTSVRVFLRAYREEPRTGDTEQTTAACFTFVAVGDDGTPVAVPSVQVETDEDERLQATARAAVDGDD